MPVWTLILLAVQGASPTVQVRGGKIEVAVADQVMVVPVGAPGPERSAVFRNGDRFVAWDERGLTITVAGKSKTTRLREVAVTPKLFSREEIQENARLAKSGQRSLEASEALGWERLGDVVYFLVRWLAGKERPWLEAVVRVDLSAERPAPSLVGRFDAFAVAPLDGDGLSRIGDRLAVVTRGSGGPWGVQILDPLTGAIESVRAGDDLRRYSWFDGKVWFVEGTTYGTETAGWFDCEARLRQVLAEARATITYVSREPQLIKLVGRRGSALRWLQSGAELRLPPATGVAMIKGWVVLFSPEKVPKKVTLYSPERWTVVSEWPPIRASRSPTEARPARAPGRFGTPPTRRGPPRAHLRRSPKVAGTP